MLYVTSEAYPFCKTGGLADVAGQFAPRPGGGGCRDRRSSCPYTTRSAPSGGRK